MSLNIGRVYRTMQYTDLMLSRDDWVKCAQEGFDEAWELLQRIRSIDTAQPRHPEEGIVTREEDRTAGKSNETQDGYVDKESSN